MLSLKPSQKTFIQWLLAERLVTHEAALAVFQRLSPSASPSDEKTATETMHLFTGEIVEALRPYDLELCYLYDHESAQPMWALVNTKCSSIAQLATSYDAAEIELFKKLVALIVETGTKAAGRKWELSSLEALTELSEGSTSKSRVQEFIADLVDQRWLVRRDNGRLALGPRTIAELHAHIRDEYHRLSGSADQELKMDCVLCAKMIATPRAEYCANEECEAMMHSTCKVHLDAGRQQREAALQCPTCNTPWPPKEHNKEKTAG